MLVIIEAFCTDQIVLYSLTVVRLTRGAHTYEDMGKCPRYVIGPSYYWWGHSNSRLSNWATLKLYSTGLEKKNFSLEKRSIPKKELKSKKKELFFS